MTQLTRPPHKGQRKLILSFDIGTTYSGVAYAFLDQGQVPEIEFVQSYPCQEQVGGNHSKIPTVIYYDQLGQVRAVGAEAAHARANDLRVDKEKWIEAKRFKLHLRPDSIPMTFDLETIRPLPPNKTVVDLFADMMKYLYKCTREYLEETGSLNMRDTQWRTLEQRNSIEFVLTHPNGWGGPQQAKMRHAAIRAGLVPDSPAGRARIHFVTEGEASLNFCVDKGLTKALFNRGDGVLIVDAGGGTIDINTYRRNNSHSATEKPSFEEIAPPQCLCQGSEFVTGRARRFLRRHLQGSKYHGLVEDAADLFDKGPKLTFRFRDEVSRIQFSASTDNDPRLGIINGKLTISGYDMASFFEPAIEDIQKVILEQQSSSSTRIATTFLVGGFAANNWLFKQLEEFLKPHGISIYRPGRAFYQKEVADGGISYYIDHLVTTRVSKYAYGVYCYFPFNSDDPEHVRRISKKFVDAAGDSCLSGGFSVILNKNVQVQETKEFRSSYVRAYNKLSEFPKKFTTDIVAYRGSSVPRWRDEDPANYFKLCEVHADGALLKNKITSGMGTKGVYYKICFDVILSFGQTELTAQISWVENGIEKRSPAEIVYIF